MNTTMKQRVLIDLAYEHVRTLEHAVHEGADISAGLERASATLVELIELGADEASIRELRSRIERLRTHHERNTP